MLYAAVAIFLENSSVIVSFSERGRDQLVCFVTRGHRHSQRDSWQERESIMNVAEPHSCIVFVVGKKRFEEEARSI